jgi:hypothetical protein
MAHFAQLNEDNIVINVVKVIDDIITDENGVESEQLGINYLKSIIPGSFKWVKTSYNDNIRVRYAQIGGHYNEKLDAFFFPKPYPSWIINETEYGWDPPVPKPEDKEGYLLQWNEEDIEWEFIKLPTPRPLEPAPEGFHYVYDSSNDVWDTVENAPMPSEPAPEGFHYVYDSSNDVWDTVEIEEQ